MKFILVFAFMPMLLMAFQVQSEEEKVVLLTPDIEIQQEPIWSLGVNYSLFDMWIPGKLGLALNKSKGTNTYLFEYQKMSYNFDFFVADIGEVSDTRTTFAIRSFAYSNSFNYFAGLTFNSIAVQLGSSWYADVGARYDAIKVTTLNLAGGIGNHFQINEKFYWGVDWIRIYYPLSTINTETKILDVISNESNRNQLKDMIDSLTSIPTMSLFQFEIGYKF